LILPTQSFVYSTRSFYCEWCGSGHKAFPFSSPFLPPSFFDVPANVFDSAFLLMLFYAFLLLLMLFCLCCSPEHKTRMSTEVEKLTKIVAERDQEIV
jgi:hypothetical protein